MQNFALKKNHSTEATVLVLGLLPTVVSLKISSCKVCFGPVSMFQLHREAPSRLTFSPPALTEIESGSSAVDSGWVISVMGFCPELARPFGALTLIIQ